MPIEELKRKVESVYGNIMFHEAMQHNEGLPVQTPEYMRMMRELQGYTEILCERMDSDAYREHKQSVEERGRLTYERNRRQ